MFQKLLKNQIIKNMENQKNIILDTFVALGGNYDKSGEIDLLRI